MKDSNEKSRTTIYIDEELIKRAEILFGEAKVNSFSAFVSKAIESYITKLVIDKNGDLLSDEIRKAIKNELGPINTRVSKGLYRYAVEIDTIVQILAEVLVIFSKKSYNKGNEYISKVHTFKLPYDIEAMIVDASKNKPSASNL